MVILEFLNALLLGFCTLLVIAMVFGVWYVDRLIETGRFPTRVIKEKTYKKVRKLIS